MPYADRAALERVLIRRAGPLMARVKMSVNWDGANPDLDDPITQALTETGYSMAAYSQPGDADIQQLPDTVLRQVTDYAEIRLLENIRSAFDYPTLQVELDRQQWSDLIRETEVAIERKSATYQVLYYGASARAYSAPINQWAPQQSFNTPLPPYPFQGGPVDQ